MRKIGILLSLCLCLFCPICSAQLPSRAAIGLGGIGPGADMSYVESVYGKPSSMADVPFEASDDRGTVYKEAVCKYGDRFSIKYIYANRQNRVIDVFSRDESIATPAGVTVGMDASVLANQYGAADRVLLWNGQTVYEYTYGHERMLFTISGGVIQLIHCCYTDAFPVVNALNPPVEELPEIEENPIMDEEW